MNSPPRAADLQQIETSLVMLKQYLAEDEIAPLIDVLELLVADPRNPALFDRLSNVFESLGSLQGAVLTYAPYLSVVLAGQHFDELE